MKPVPPGWGLNSLTAFLDGARANQFATFHHKTVAKDLAAIDHVLWKVLDGTIDPKPMFPVQFLLRSHSCFRAAASCSLAGQVYEATVLQRAALEVAAYGLFIGSDSAKAELWLRREDSNSAKERVRTQFGYGNLRRHFEQHHPALAPAFVSLYETSVDFGAHPNEAGFSINMSLRRENKQKIFDTIYLHDDGVPLDFALKNVARVGLWIVLTFREMYPEKYLSSEVEATVDALVPNY